MSAPNKAVLIHQRNVCQCADGHQHGDLCLVCLHILSL